MLKQAENLKVKKKKNYPKYYEGLTRTLKRVFPRTFLETAVLPR